MTVADRTSVVVVEMKVVELETVPFDLFVVVAHYAVGEQSFAASLVSVAVADIATFAAVEWWAALLFGEHSCPSDPCSVSDWDCWEVPDPVLASAVALLFVE